MQERERELLKKIAEVQFIFHKAVAASTAPEKAAEAMFKSLLLSDPVYEAAMSDALWDFDTARESIVAHINQFIEQDKDRGG